MSIEINSELLSQTIAKTQKWRAIARPSTFTIMINHNHYLILPVYAQKEGQIRLVGSTDKWQGRVEIFHNKTWGTICDDYWDINYANVVCKQLGFGAGLEVYMAADFGKGTGPIHLDRLRCYGNESKILDCDPKGWNHNYCTHDEDVGVACMHASKSECFKRVGLRLFI